MESIKGTTPMVGSIFVFTLRGGMNMFVVICMVVFAGIIICLGGESNKANV
ncbi:MAG: hypothetical protein IJ326_00155 [Lachnospiraceae bacterium]|nr:hypothetical protein [Lachnospiraceae bacterium]